MDSHNILSLLGLSLRGGHLVVGEEPVEAAARARDIRLLLLASDAAEGTRRRAEHFARTGQCLWLTLPFPKAELGRAVGRTAAAVVAVTDTGLAHAVALRLADLDEAQYGEAAQRLTLKAKRAAERQAERQAQKQLARTERRKANPQPSRPPEDRRGSGQRRPAAPAARGRPEPPEGRRRPPGTQKSGTAPDRRPPRRQTASSPHAPSQGGSRSRPNPYAHSRPVKKGKGSFRKREG